jgi:hypothetical protein
MTYSADDFPPGSKERVEVAMHSAGAACNPEDVIEDWGHYDEDYTATEAAIAWENTDVDSTDRVYSLPAVDSLNDLYDNS